MIDLKTRAVAPFSPDARTFHNIYKLQKHVLLRHQSYLIVVMGNKNSRFWQIMPLLREFKLLCTLQQKNYYWSTAMIQLSSLTLVSRWSKFLLSSSKIKKKSEKFIFLIFLNFEKNCRLKSEYWLVIFIFRKIQAMYYPEASVY